MLQSLSSIAIILNKLFFDVLILASAVFAFIIHTESSDMFLELKFYIKIWKKKCNLTEHLKYFSMKTNINILWGRIQLSYVLTRKEVSRVFPHKD